MACASTSTASTFLRLLRASASRALSCTTVARVSGTTPEAPKTWASAFATMPSVRKAIPSALMTRPSSRASTALVRSSARLTLRVSASFPSSTPRAPAGPLSRSAAVCRWRRLAFSGASPPVSALRLVTRSRTLATMRGISAAASPRSTLRSAPSGNGGSLRMPLKARILVLPTSPFSIVKTLVVRSQWASLRGTSTMMRALPSGDSSMRPTRPTGKPAKVMSMPTTTPSESSASSTSCWVRSKAPRAYMR